MCENWSSGFPNRYDINSIRKGLKLEILDLTREERLYDPCNENEGVDQLRNGHVVAPKMINFLSL